MNIKKLFVVSAVLFFAAGTALAYQSPGRPTGFVNDFGNVLSSVEKSDLERSLSSFEASTTVEISVVTVPSLGGDYIENYAEKLFKEWGIGKEKKDNGVLVLLALKERELRIEVGYGMEPLVTDTVAALIIRDVMVPALKRGDYFLALNGAVEKIMGIVKNDPEALAFVKEGSSGSFSFSNLEGVLVFMFVFGVNLFVFMARTKSWWLGGVIGAILGAIFLGFWGALAFGLVGFVTDFILSKWGGKLLKNHKGPHGPWFMGGGGHGSGDSGFGGFGGGTSGGGGSSGRW